MRNHKHACWRNNILEKQAMRAAKWYAENNEYATSCIPIESSFYQQQKIPNPATLKLFFVRSSFYQQKKYQIQQLLSYFL